MYRVVGESWGVARFLMGEEPLYRKVRESGIGAQRFTGSTPILEMECIRVVHLGRSMCRAMSGQDTRADGFGNFESARLGRLYHTEKWRQCQANGSNVYRVLRITRVCV